MSQLVFGSGQSVRQRGTEDGSANVVVVDSLTAAIAYGPIQIVGSDSAPQTIDASEVLVTGYVDLSKLSEVRSLWLDTSGGGTGTFSISMETSIDADDTVVGESFSLATGVAGGTQKTIDLPFSTLPYTPYGRFTITETGGANNVTLFAFIMGRGVS